MSTVARDPIATASTLERWLSQVAGLDDVRVTNVAIPGATGWSNETILFDASWREDDRVTPHELVARIAPTAHTVFPDRTFTAQFEVMRALAGHGAVPMATIHWLEQSTEWFDSEFWIMDRIRGDVPSDNPPYAGSGWLHDASPADQARAWWSGIEATATIHRLDVEHLGPGLDHCGTRPRPADRAARPLRALSALGRGRPALPAGPSRPGLAADPRRRATRGGTVPHLGDSRLANLIFRDFEVVAVLDWEMSSVADPLLDLGWWIFSDEALTRGAGLTRLAGFPTGAETAAGWSELTGRSVDSLPYYEVLAAFRFTVIMLRMGKLLQGIGLVPDDFAYDNLISQALADRL